MKFFLPAIRQPIRSIRWKFLLPLGTLTILVTITVVGLLIRDDQIRLKMVAKKRGAILIHSIYSASYVLRTKTVLQRYIETLSHHPGIESISIYDKKTNTITASTTQTLRGKSPETVHHTDFLASQIKKVQQEQSTIFDYLPYPNDLVYVAGQIPSFPGKRNPTEIENSIVLLTFHKSYFKGIVTDLTSKS